MIKCYQVFYWIKKNKKEYLNQQIKSGEFYSYINDLFGVYGKFYK